MIFVLLFSIISLFIFVSVRFHTQWKCPYLLFLFLHIERQNVEKRQAKFCPISFSCCPFFVTDSFRVATTDYNNSIPSDVHDSISDSLEYKCVVAAYLEKEAEVKLQITFCLPASRLSYQEWKSNNFLCSIVIRSKLIDCQCLNDFSFSLR